MLNQQSPITLRQSDPDKLEVFKIFPTIQGEGPFTGRPATFIRLYGCNLQCPWCDTDYTSQRHDYNAETLVNLCVSHISRDAATRRPLVVITGGEPFRHNLSFLVTGLCNEGFDVQIETNGTLPPDGVSTFRATIVCSPKAPKVNPLIERFCKNYKYVLNAAEVDPGDGLPGITLGGMRPARPPADFHGDIWVAPMDARDSNENESNMRAAVDSCLKFGYRLSVQTHKIANLE